MEKINEIYISIADIQIELRTPLSATELKIDKKFEHFLQRKKKVTSDVVINWREQLDLIPPPGRLIYDPGSIWRMYKTDEAVYVVIKYPRKYSSSSLMCINDNWSDIHLSEHRVSSEWKSHVQTGAGELILRTNILLKGGLVFHASGIDDNGRGILFVGHSGAGKSTQIKFWNKLPGVVPMSDDRIAVRLFENEVICYGTPWGGSANISSNHNAPVSAIILLQQASQNKIIQLSASKAAPLLFTKTFLPFWSDNLMNLVSSNLNRLLTKVPVYLLESRAEPQTTSIVRSIL
jgi:hypothetical protein